MKHMLPKAPLTVKEDTKYKDPESWIYPKDLRLGYNDLPADAK